MRWSLVGDIQESNYLLLTDRVAGVEAFPKPHQVKANGGSSKKPLLLISPAWE